MPEPIPDFSHVEARGSSALNLSRMLALPSAPFRGWGIWTRGARTLEEAERQMARHAVGLLDPGADHRVIAVGAADAAFSMLRSRAPEGSVAAVNVSGDARLTYDAESVDRILALDCASHYESRSAFFHEAYRVLRPGGRLVLLEVGAGTRSMNPVYALMKRAVVRQWQLPGEGLYDLDEYERALTDAGFPEPSVRSLADHVFPGAVSFYLSDEARRQARDRSGAIAAWTWAQTVSWLQTLYVEGQIDYVQVIGRKP